MNLTAFAIVKSEADKTKDTEFCFSIYVCLIL